MSTDPPLQTASRKSQPFFHNTHSLPMDSPTERTRNSTYTNIYRAMRFNNCYFLYWIVFARKKIYFGYIQRIVVSAWTRWADYDSDVNSVSNETLFHCELIYSNLWVIISPLWRSWPTTDILRVQCVDLQSDPSLPSLSKHLPCTVLTTTLLSSAPDGDHVTIRPWMNPFCPSLGEFR